VRFAETGGLAALVHVEDEIDVALRIMADVLRPVIAHVGEAERQEEARERIGIGAGKFDEFETVEAKRVIVRGHGKTPFNPEFC
jgi:hypothetical protein